MAEANSSYFLRFCWSRTLDAGHGTRDSKTRLATLALDGLYFIHPEGPERKGEDYKVDAGGRFDWIANAMLGSPHPLKTAKGGAASSLVALNKRSLHEKGWASQPPSE